MTHLTLRQYCPLTPYPLYLEDILRHAVNVEDYMNHLDDIMASDPNLPRINRQLLKDARQRKAPSLSTLHILLRSIITI